MQENDNEPTFTDKLADEAAPPEKPAGSPPMRPFRTLKNRDKTALLRTIAPAMTDDGGDFATGVDLLDVALDACMMLAIDADSMDEWLEGEGGLRGAVDLFAWYMRRFEVGEAFASLLS